MQQYQVFGLDGGIKPAFLRLRVSARPTTDGRTDGTKPITSTATKNVWPAPVCKGIVKPVCSVYVNISGLGIMTRPRWRSAQPSPDSRSGLDQSFPGLGLQAAVRLSGHLSLITRRSPRLHLSSRRPSRFLCRSGRRTKAALLAQHRLRFCAATCFHRHNAPQQLVDEVQNPNQTTNLLL